ncbi:MAG: response regulator transcription factor [Bacteroidales bacterium]|nr:response regulator transcription factor [Bacteroidales bacterium]
MNITTPKILIVDDETYTLDFLGYNLNKQGFKVYTSTRGHDAITKAKKILPQLILLDIMMPEMDGIETCIELRKINELKDTLIALISARREDYTQIVGFEAGADDYIKKPIAINVLIVRLKALLKRLRNKENKEILEIDNIKIIRDKYVVVKDEEIINLPRREFELLYLLASNPRKIFTREEIMSKIWGDEAAIGDRTINVHISRIRNKLNFPIIKTVKGIGYCLRTDE